MIALLSFPIMIGLASLAEPTVLLMYGERWRASITIIQLLAFSGMAQSLYNTAGWVFLSQGRTEIVFRLGVYATLVRAAGVAAAIPWGINGVAWAYLVGTYGFLLYPTWRTAGRLVDLRFTPMLKNVAGPFFCSLAMGAVAIVCDRSLLGHFAAWQRIAVLLPLSILVYGFLIHQCRLKAWGDVRGVCLQVLRSEDFHFLDRVLGHQAYS